MGQASTLQRDDSGAATDIRDVIDLCAGDMAEVDRLIRASLDSDVVLIRQIAEYIIGSGGKRLRPMLVVLAARACGYVGSHHVTLAAVIEFNLRRGGFAVTRMPNGRRALEAASDEKFDLIVTDPPYGLSPDGRARTWDDIEALRAEYAKGRQPDYSAWWSEVNTWRERFPLGYRAPDDGGLAPQYVIERLGAIA